MWNAKYPITFLTYQNTNTMALLEIVGVVHHRNFHMTTDGLMDDNEAETDVRSVATCVLRPSLCQPFAQSWDNSMFHLCSIANRATGCSSSYGLLEHGGLLLDHPLYTGLTAGGPCDIANTCPHIHDCPTWCDDLSLAVRPLSICRPVGASRTVSLTRKLTTHLLNPIPIFNTSGLQLMPPLANQLPGCTVFVRFSIAIKFINGIYIFNAITERIVLLNDLVVNP
ncbi:hypothetical protein K439DRAFT_279682 [Ramaria rubella]|nr:hypothetical protein K439DRAFT_279682 [Ramaria rubella]